MIGKLLKMIILLLRSILYLVRNGLSHDVSLQSLVHTPVKDSIDQQLDAQFGQIEQLREIANKIGVRAANYPLGVAHETGLFEDYLGTKLLNAPIRIITKRAM